MWARYQPQVAHRRCRRWVVVGGRVGAGLLIHAGAGGVGSVAIPMAKYLGAKVYTTTRAANRDYVRQRGADVAIDYSTSDYAALIREAEPRGLDCVVETLLDEAAILNAPGLVRDGGAVVYLNNEPPDLPEIAGRGIRTTFLHHRADGDMLAFLAGLFADGTLPLPEIGTTPLEEARDAHRKSESGTTRGKLANLHAALGDAYRESGDLRAAIGEYRKALDRCPHFHDVRQKLAVALRENGLPHQAIRELERILFDRFASHFVEARAKKAAARKAAKQAEAEAAE